MLPVIYTLTGSAHI